MAIGRLGSLKFICNHKKVQTFFGLSRSSEIRYEQHPVIGKKPVLEFVGYGLMNASFSMRFDMSLGVTPIACLEKLRKMMNNKKYKTLVVGDEILGRYVIENIEETRKIHAGDGTLLVAEVTVNLIEWSKGK